MKYLLIILSFLAISELSAQIGSPEGRWTTTDEETGKAKSVVEIYAKGGAYYGKVVEILTGNTTAVCSDCEGHKKNQPILGMVIVEDLKADGDAAGEWTGGTILDPQKGATYRLSVWYEDKHPDVLYVRGKHWTGLYRTQEWIRE
ncbi:uncharacterized protein (DUF2147 family) [Lewinella marina]|uniref:DUF2147 domain-containing protein n=1 Tax=Neolewinella marina TaxID=438751 RepID=A0A2G0CHM7_9BACT|nr:DUF2147 domain-containing protein [Neolewinella marina]NJB86167.1 uncharacterized protein (DUF2147 family) [Neolewinella marina]PHK99479.1 hypothetical protein CGL56_07850 [Neolewinella marina]